MFTNDSFITGDKLQKLCDVYCGSEKELNKNSEKEKHINIENLNSQWDNPKIIFCYNSILLTFIKKLHLLKNIFVLVSHNDDINITKEFIDLAESPLLIRWFTKNIMFEHPKIHILPTGIINSLYKNNNLNILNDIINLKLNKEDKIHFYFNLNNNNFERTKCKYILENKGLKFENFNNYFEYLKNLSKCKFAICPPSDGIDCYKNWECYYCGVIPIFLYSKFAKILSEKLPCIILYDWNDFDYDEIMKKYEELAPKIYKNKRYLDFNYYKTIFNVASKCSIKHEDLRKYNFRSFSLTDSRFIPLDFKLDTIINKNNGFFIELGANDGIKQSNTAFFEFFRNWNGILIEPSKNMFELCVSNRPRSKCYNYACVSDNFTDEEISGDFNGDLMSSVNGNRLQSFEKITVKTITLEKLLDQNNIKSIDLLSLDTEGYELNILKGLNLNKYKPTFIIIEIYNYQYIEILKVLEEYNYSLICNFSNYNKKEKSDWDGTHNDYLFMYTNI